MELVRTTEAAALAAGRWMGRGEKEGADGAAVDAMRVVLQTVSMDGIVVIGEGEKDRAPMLFNGERIGNGSPPETDIAVDPIEGTTLTALGRGGALSVIAVSDRGTMFDPGPCVYMEKLAVGPRAAGSVDITQTPTENIEGVAKALGKSVRDVTVVVLERDRHNDLIAEVRDQRCTHQAPRARRRRWRDVDGVARLGGRSAARSGRYSRRGARRRGAQVHGWPHPGKALAAGTTSSGPLRSKPATTSTRSSTRTLWSAGTTASSRPPG